MAKEKKKFNLSSLLRIYLRKKNKGLHHHSCRAPPAADATSEDAPLPGGAWTVKLLQMIHAAVSAGDLWSGFSAQAEEPAAADELRWGLFLLMAAGGKKSFWFAGFLLSNKILIAEASLCLKVALNLIRNEFLPLDFCLTLTLFSMWSFGTKASVVIIIKKQFCFFCSQ